MTCISGNSACIHDRVKEQADKTPDAIAVVSGEEQLTYKELDARANQLAHWLQTQGAGPDILIGLFIERSLDMVIGLLAILKSGSAYVPLDPVYPKERISYILNDTKLTLLLTQSKLKHSLPNYPARPFCIDTDWDSIKDLKTSDPDCQVSCQNLAYVIYTSGSTGEPKGVLIEHQSLKNYIHYAIDIFEITSTDRVLQFASLSFDTAAEEIYPVLVQGGTLVLRTDEMLASPAQFLSACAEWEITILDLPTSYWHLLVDSIIEHDLNLFSIRLIIIGGERALRKSVIEWNRYINARHKEISLWNTYGPTETTIVATTCEISSIVDDPRKEVPIGKTIHNVQAYVLNKTLQPVSDDEPGELFIGGICLAREYLNQPDLTAQIFIPNPFSKDPNTKLYKTGDIVRRCQNGDLEYIGRVDDQVKIDGFRVELGEIESAMVSHPKIDNAVACIKENGPNKKLLAYVVSKLPSTAINSELRNHLQKTLPHYMIPQLVTKLDTLPLTVNGKVDRKALLELQIEPIHHNDKYIPPRTSTEKHLETIWKKLLNHEDAIGINDDFFMLGGHSLLAIKALVRINEEFRTSLSLKSFFEYSTIERMALLIDDLPTSNFNETKSHIQPRTNKENIPLSFLQEGIWVFENIEPGTTVHTVSQGFHLRGRLNINILNKSINEIIRRHEILRTSYDMQGDKPIQIINESLILDLVPLDLRNHVGANRRQILHNIMQDEVNQPFAFPKGSLIRARLFINADNEHTLFFLIHHSVFDGWSLGLFLRELESLYGAFIKEQPSPLQEISIQYADYAVWQRQMLQGDDLAEIIAYWREKLSGDRSANLLPTDYPRKIKRGSRGAVELLELPKNVVESLTTVGSRYNASSFMVFFAAFTVLIYRYIGEKDITIGSLLAGRSHPELEKIIGYIANTLPFRIQVDPSNSFKNHLERVRELCLEVYANQDIPFDLLAQQLQRDLKFDVDLADILFIHYHVKDRHLELPGLKVTPFDVYANSAHGDLTIFVDESDDGALVIAEYNTDIFKAETIHRFLKHYEQITKSIIVDPDTPIAQLRVLPDEELEQRQRWNSNQAATPDTCIHTLIERQAKTTPNATAVVCEGETFSYRKLHERSNQVAHYLQALGVGPNVIVGLCIEPSIEMLLGLLGILKAGGAYLPLDPSHPRERLALMLEDTSVMVSLTQEPLQSLLPINEMRVVCMDSDWEKIAQSRKTPVSTNVKPDDPAYVIYTSGSTGRPKGVMVQHAAAVHFIMNIVPKLNFSDQDTFLAMTRLSFDPSVLELLLPLTIGAKTVIVSREVAMNPEKIVAVCKSAAVTVVQATPTAWRLLLMAKWHDLPVKALCGGETMHIDLAKDLINFAGSVWNIYGPTETTVWCTCYEIEDPEKPLLIGHPIKNSQCYLLDVNMQHVPIGVTGELYIGGAGVTLGYLNRPKLTTNHFVPDPYSDDPSARLFKTGDFARYHSNGDIEYLGRHDSQVKIRGFRIELGEIEATLCKHREVKQAVVLVREQQMGDQRLIAYVVFKSDKSSPAQLKKELKKILPEYMVPQHIVALETFPTTSTGKIDRKALTPTDSTSEKRYLPPITSTERYLSIIWEEALGLEADTAGLKDDFFNLGGHSLLAIQVISRITRELNIELSLRLLFESGDLQDLANRIDDIRLQNRKDHKSKSLIVPLQINDSGVPLFCICGIDLYRYLAHALPTSRPVYALFIPGESDMLLDDWEDALENFPSVEELASRYVEAIIGYLPKGPMHIAGISFGGILAYEVALQLRERNRDVGVLAIFDAFHSDCFTLRPFGWALRGLHRAAREVTYGLLQKFKSIQNLTPQKQNQDHNVNSPHPWGVDEINMLRSEAYKVAMEAYEFKEYPNKTVVFKASETNGGIAYNMKPDYGWSSSVSGDLSIHYLPGDHLGILRNPSVQLLGRRFDSHMLNAEKQMEI